MAGRRHKQTYLDIAAKLKPELERIDGFLSIERFQSLVDDSKLLRRAAPCRFPGLRSVR